jgi:hypothetical protein
MASKLSSSLKTDLPALAELLRSKGRGKDTVLAHITPKEAALLKRRGGRGSVNPYTGLLEFEDDIYDAGGDMGAVAPQSPVYDVIQPGGTFTQYDPGTGFEQQYAPGGDAYVPSAPTYQLADYGGGGGGGGDYTEYVQQPSQVVSGTFGQDMPLYNQQTGQALSPAEVAAQNANLYPGGELPPAGYGTIYSGGQAAYAPEENLDAYAQYKTLSEEDQKKVEEESKKSGKSWWETLAALAAAGLIGLGLTKKQQQAGTQAAQQAQQAADKIQQIAVPYQKLGTGLYQSAQRGELSAANQQVVNAARAQAAQNIQRRGGVGVLQYANSIADLTDRLLQSQFNQGLAVSQIGDNYALQAINAGLSGNQAVNQANSQFYTQLAQLLGPTILTAAGGTAPTAAQRPTGIGQG